MTELSPNFSRLMMINGIRSKLFQPQHRKIFNALTLNNMLMRSENCGLIGIESLEKYKRNFEVLRVFFRWYRIPIYPQFPGVFHGTIYAGTNRYHSLWIWDRVWKTYRLDWAEFEYFMHILVPASALLRTETNCLDLKSPPVLISDVIPYLGGTTDPNATIDHSNERSDCKDQINNRGSSCYIPYRS